MKKPIFLTETEKKDLTTDYGAMYNFHSDVKTYVDKYAKAHGITADEALKHSIVKDYISAYANDELN